MFFRSSRCPVKLMSFFQCHAAHAVAQFLQIALLGRGRAAGDQTMHGESASLQPRNQFDQVFVPFQPCDAARQGEQQLAGSLRKLGIKRLLPDRIGFPSVRIGRTIDTAMDHLNMPRQRVGVFAQDVIAHGIRHRNHPFAARHDAAVAIDAIQAMHRGDKARARGRIHAAPREISDPRRHARAGVDDVDFLLQQELPQLADQQQRFKALAANRPGEVFAPAATRARPAARQPTSPVRGGRARQRLRDFERAALHPARFECGQQLQDG